MKKILFLIILICPLFVFGQSKGDYLLTLNYGIVLDENHSDLDEDGHSPDMYTGYNDRDDAKNSVKISASYHLTDNMLFGVSYMNSEIEGSNEIEIWNGEFAELNVFVELEILEMNDFGVYAKCGLGNISFDSFRNLVFDGGQVPLNSYSGDSNKLLYGSRASYQISKNINLSLEITRNIVNHDGFDGWDYGSGKDRFLYQSIGISFNLK
ncbi:outer membrane beta-barrel protein [Flavobacteriales bacterium]|nr:outer membrane beta-barrel protein [Flavobacteriales bacterium]